MARANTQFERGFFDKVKNWSQSLSEKIAKTSSSVDAKIRMKLLQAGSGFSPQKFIKNLATPILLAGLTLSLTIKFLVFRIFPVLDAGFLHYLPLILPLLSLLIVLFYPYTLVESRRNDMDSKIYLYITYLGTLSTAHPTRRMLFHMASEKEDYGELAKESGNIFRLGDSWGLGYIKACRIISKIVPSRIFSDFLARTAHSFQAGEDTSDFLIKEQMVVMNHFDAEYRGSLYSIESLKNMYASLSTTLAFITCFGLLVPFITGQSFTKILWAIILAFIFIDSFTLYMILTTLPKDNLIHELQIETKGMRQLKTNFKSLAVMSIILFVLALFSNRLSMPYIIALSITPLGYFGYLVGREENRIKHKEANFGPFMRTLGGAAGARSGQIRAVLGTIRYHEYGPLTKHIDSLYRRLQLGDSMRAWQMFAGEIGSDLILKFSMIFREGLQIGANPGEISMLISTNFERVTALRGERQLTSSSMKGTLYGAGIGMALAIYVTIGIIQFLMEHVSDLTGIEQIMSGASSVSGINIQFVYLMVWIALVIHSGLAALTLKFTDGGDVRNALFHFCIMIWISALIAGVMPPLFTKMFGVNLSSTPMG